MRTLQIFRGSIRSRFSPGRGRKFWLVQDVHEPEQFPSFLPFPGRRPWEFRFSQLASRGDSLFDPVKAISVRFPKCFHPLFGFRNRSRWKSSLLSGQGANMASCPSRLSSIGMAWQPLCFRLSELRKVGYLRSILRSGWVTSQPCQVWPLVSGLVNPFG